MIVAASAALLVCAIPMPLKAGQEAKDRDIAMIRAPIPAAMVTSLQGPAPRSSFKFTGEPEERHEWIIANPKRDENGLMKMLRLTPQSQFFDNPYKVRMGDAKTAAGGSWEFKLISEGACHVEAAANQAGRPGQ